MDSAVVSGVSERYEDEWNIAGGEFHRGGEASVHHCHVGTREMAVPTVDVRPLFDPVDGPASDGHQVGNAAQQIGPDA